MADTDELTDDTQDRVAAFQRQADVIQSMRNADAASYQPPGSPSEFLGRESQPLSPVSYLQANGQTGPMLVPRGAEGIRGYPSQDELTGPTAASRDRYNANVAAAFPTGISGPLGNAANVNFASKDDALNLDVNNAIGRYPSAPRFNMPSTDQLIDAGIQSKRNAIQNEINTRLVHLGQLPPSVIGASATTLDSEQAPVTSVGRHGQTRYGASQADRTRAELAILQHSASNLDRAQAGVIQQNSRLALQNAKDNESLSQDMAGGQVVDFLSNIDDSRYPHGSPDRQQFIGKVFGSRPDWLHVIAKDPNLAKYVQDHVDAQAKVASTIAQLKTLYPDLEVTPKSINSRGGTNYNVGLSAEDKAAQKPVPEKTADRYAKLVGDITFHEKNQPIEEAANASANKPNTPYSQAAKWGAAIAEKQQIERRYPALAPQPGDNPSPSPAPTGSEGKGAAHDKVIVEKGGRQFKLPRTQLQDALGDGYQLVK